MNRPPYLKRMSKEKLIELGDLSLSKHLFGYAIVSYDSAGYTEGLINCGKKALKYFEVNDVIELFDESNTSIPKDLFAEFGDRLLSKCYVYRAILAYKISGVDINTKKDDLIKCGYKTLNEDELNKSIKAFNKAGCKEGLMKCGELALNSEYHLDRAIEAFDKAGSKEGLMKCIDKAIREEKVSNIILACDKAGVELPKEKLIELGYKLLNDNVYTSIRAFEKTGHNQGLIKCADKYLKDGSLDYALNNYEKAGVKPPKDEIINYAEKQLSNGFINDAIKAYEAIDVELPIDKIINQADKSLDKISFKQAIIGFDKAGSKEGLIKCGKLALNYDYYLNDAIEAFDKAGSKEGLLKCGVEALNRGKLSSALEAYEKAGEDITNNKNGLIKCGKACLKNNAIPEAIKSYDLAQAVIPKDKLNNCGLNALINDRIIDALMAYDRTGTRVEDILLLKLAEEAVDKHGFLDEAIAAYEKAGVDIKTDKRLLIKCAERLIELDSYGEAYLIDYAKDAYRMAGLSEDEIEFRM